MHTDNANLGVLQEGNMEKRDYSKFIFFFALLLISLRFFYPGIVQFISDEAIFQEWADEAAHGAGFRLVGMGGSSIPVAYGAGAVWLYQIPHLLSSHPLAFTLFHTIIYSTCFIFLYLTLRRFLGRKPASFALLAASSSPFLFFFSRHTWDTTFFVPFTSAMIYAYSTIVYQSKTSPWSMQFNRIWPLFMIAILAALSINIQLAIGPFILVIFAALLFWLLKDERKNLAAWLAVVSCGIFIILLCLPYAFAALDFMHKNAAYMAHTKQARWGDVRHFWWNIQYTLFGLSVWKAGLFFQPIYAKFAEFSGLFFAKLFYLDPFGWLMKLASMAVFFGLFAKLAKGKIFQLSHLEFLTLAGFILILIVFQYLNVPVQPHYFQSVWWVPFCLLGFAYSWAEQKSEKSQKIFSLAFGGLIFTNAAFLILSLSFLKINGGTRGMHHSTGILETRAALNSFCENLKSDPQFSNQKEISIDISRIEMGNPPIEYFLKRDSACEGHSFQVSMTPLPAPNFYLEYIDSTGNNARFHAVKAK